MQKTEQNQLIQRRWDCSLLFKNNKQNAQETLCLKFFLKNVIV